MNLHRRSLLIASALAPLAAQANPFAGKTLRLLVGFPPGGGTDAIARLLAEPLKELLGAPVIVENKAGAGGQLAAQALKAAAPDGTTVFLSHDHSISILPLVLKNPGFDPAQDFAPVAGFASFVNAIALSTGTPALSLAEFLSWVKEQPKARGSIGVPAPASIPEFLVKALATRQGLDLVPLPYRGSAPMMAEMLGNQIPAGVGSVPDLIENHRAGRLRIVAVMGAERQRTLLPEVPTLAELGIAGFEPLPYYGLFAPAATPVALRETWATALQKVLPGLKPRLEAMGLNVGFSSGPELAAREREYARAWGKLIRESGFVAG